MTASVRGVGKKLSLAQRRAVVAIPARNEAERIGECLSALALQRDSLGAPLAPETFAVIVVANNCTDETAQRALDFSGVFPYRLDVVEISLDAARAHAGGARRVAMDAAAEQLQCSGLLADAILTTDADSCPAQTWVSENLAAFNRGVDCVAGFVEPRPAEYVCLGRSFMERGRLEDTYQRLICEIESLCDPILHDPWPRHRMTSGASLAITLDAYLAIGGLPEIPVGEDAALVRAVEDAGLSVRHSFGPQVSTSCRLSGRAVGGAADAIRARHTDLDAECDHDFEPAMRIFIRAVLRGRLRLAFRLGSVPSRLAARFGLSASACDALCTHFSSSAFVLLWKHLEANCSELKFGPPLRPSALPDQIRKARRIILWLRRLAQAKIAQDDTPRHLQSFEMAVG